MRWIGGIIAVALLAGGAVFIIDYFHPGRLIINTGIGSARRREAELARRILVAEERSRQVRGLYMTSIIATDRGRAATRIRENIVALLDETELNGLVIDVKETEGGLVITDATRELIRRLHEQDIWVIARLVVFKDNSQEKIQAGWYLRRRDGGIWRDNRGGSWIDPASEEVWAYQLALAKAASDAGFDEIQFDYVRFPSDGDVERIVYPVYDGKQPKYEVLRAFFRYLHDELKTYRPDLMLSADLFGYVALESEDLGIGQRLTDIGENFDYVSLMVYPSHYYGGFEVAGDPMRNLPALRYPYRSRDPAAAAGSHPYDVVYRTLLIAEDILSGRATSSAASATSTAAALPPPAHISQSETRPGRAARRPWLQDFDLAVDSARGIHYDAAKVRAQIDAAEAAGASGWLLWSPNNVYAREALKPE